MKAFRCDRCGEFQEGEPRRYKVSEFLTTSLTGWGKRKERIRAELCDDCGDELEEKTEAWMEGDA